MKYVPYVLCVLSLGLASYVQTWPSFALFCVLTLFIVYREVMEEVKIKGSLKPELKLLEDRIKLLEEKSDALNAKMVQNTFMGKR